MKFYKYTPALLDPKTLDETLIGRDVELGNIMRILKNASSGQSISHAIFIGPKGIGKTHILRILYHAVKGDIETKGLNIYKEKFIPVIFSEEEYPGNITKFIMLALQYLYESKSGEAPPIPEELVKPAALNERHKELAFSYLKTFREKTGKTLLLLVDNIGDIIERFTDEDQSSLREALMTYNSILLIGSAPTLFDSIINHDRPLYNFYEIIWLKDLGFEETAALLKRYAELDGRNDLIEKFKESEPKLRAIHKLAGGNPRLILSLYHIVIEGDISSVEATFLKLLDELSPYFRERIKDLSEQQREIIDVIARAENLLTPTEIAERCLLPVNVVNSQLKRLENIGYVRKPAKKLAKKVFYDLNERLFSLWRQMRVEAGRRRLGFIVRFLEIWFTKKELNEYLKKAIEEFINIATIGDKDKIKTCADKIWYIKESLPDMKDFPYYDIFPALAEGDFKKFADSLEKSIKINPQIAEWLFLLGWAYSMLNNDEKAIDSYKKAIEIKPDYEESWNNLCLIYLMLSIINYKNDGLLLDYIRLALSCLPRITERQFFFEVIADILKNLVEEKRLNIIKIVLKEIETANQPELLEFLSPYLTLIKYLETKDREVLERLHYEERMIVEDMLKMME
ncbi:MAG: tetratricopeptide repeat protein [Nitrospinae bacterium]|nr:tetratricopeptide repeat protein [Nitrospinota bacterium]